MSSRTASNLKLSPSPSRIPRLLIRASAGTGKTFQLSSRYIDLLRHSSPERILASTFTRKAAGEILERILLRLARACESTKSLRELASSIQDEGLSREECLEMLTRLTRQLHRVRISTLDSFFAQLAGSHALELGFPSGWRILDPVEVSQLRDQSLEQMLREGDQQELVQLMHMLDKGDSSRSVSGLMRQTIDDLYHVYLESAEEAWDCFPEHHFLSPERRQELLTQLETYPIEKKRMKAAVDAACDAIRAERWDDFQGKGLMPKIRTPDRKYYSDVIPDSLCDIYLELYEHCQALTSTTWKQQTRAAWRLLNDFHQIFERMKQSAGGLEFGDVTRRLASISRSNLELDSSYRMDGAIEHLMLDEFQDTSRPQWAAIRRFAEQVCQGEAKSFFCVGDVKQAIYGWRGGEAAIFDAISEQLPNLTSQPLNLSYRSSPVIIDAVNLAMTGVKNHDNFDGHEDLLHNWCKNFPRQETSRTDLSGYACLHVGPEAPESDGGKPTSRDQKDVFQRYTAEYVANLVHQHPGSTVGILTRGNSAVGRMIYDLGRLGIEASEEGGNPLTDAAGVQLILSLMKLADHPGDTISAFHVAQSPLGPLLGYERHDDWQKTNEFSLELRRRLMRQGYGGLIHELTIKLMPVCDQREHRRLIQLAGLADRFDVLFPTLRPSQFVTYASSQRCEEPSSASVRVMNIHQSKGLEFDIVVLPELNSRLLMPPRYVTGTSRPGGVPELVAVYRSEEHFVSMGGDLLAARQQTRDRMLQESLCVLYVALTRAARSLHMLIPAQVNAKLPKTYAGLLRAALAPQAPLEPMKTIWELGDPNWDHASHAPKAQPPAEGPSTSASMAPLQFRKSAASRHLPQSSPTKRKSGAERIQIGTKLRIADSGADRGTLFHRWLQEIIWIDETPVSIEKLHHLGRSLTSSQEELTSYCDQFLKAIELPGIRQLLSRSGYNSFLKKLAAQFQTSPDQISLEVRNELPFVQVLEEGGLLQGIIDRVILFHHQGQLVAAEIIDFKTDRVTTEADTRDLMNFYRPQILAYRSALGKLFGLSSEQIESRLVFLGNGNSAPILPA